MKIKTFNKEGRNTSLRLENISALILTGYGFYIIYDNKKLSKLVLFWEPEFENNLEKLPDVLFIDESEWGKLEQHIDDINIKTYQ